MPQKLPSAILVLIGLLWFNLDVFAQAQPKPDTSTLQQTAIRQRTQHQFGLDPNQPLSDRVRPASESTLTMFKEAGMSPSPIQHVLTDTERDQLQKVFAALPPLHQQILREHLRSISFLDNMPNTALTATVNNEASFPVFDITVRAAIFNQTASEWMTEKERTLFTSDDSSVEVFCEIGSLSALLYVLLHETTHMVDGVLQLSQNAGFSHSIWRDRTHIAPDYSQGLLDSTRYRGGGSIPAWQAKALYQTLIRTPFVSLYSTSSWNEDLAEYLSIYHFTQKLNQPFRIILRNNGKQVFVYEPMKSKLVQTRIKEMARFYTLPPIKG